MWIMMDTGILMPAVRPKGTYAADDDMRLQVRSRDRKSLDFCRRQMIAEGFDTTPVMHTPDYDYEYRFYCTHEDFAEYVSNRIREIDYEKFKPTTERRKWSRHLHGLYNRIWGEVFTHYNPPKVRK